MVPASASTADATARAALAPTGVLRVGVYSGSPTSLILDPRTGAKVGIAHDLGAKLASDLGVPLELLEFRRVAEVIDALKVGRVDFTFTNATTVRAKDMDSLRRCYPLSWAILFQPRRRLQMLLMLIFRVFVWA